MEKTPFAGLTILEPGEGLDSDNGAFIDRDRLTIDHFAKLGAKLHRHSGEAGLLNPTIPASGAVVASGGTIASDLTISLGYTVEDAQGGETMLSPLAVVSTGSQMDIPIAAPSAAVETTGGSLLVNQYYYAVTWTDGDGGETPAGPAVAAERAPGFASGRVKLTNLTYGMAAAGAVGWRLFRAIGGGTYDLLTTGGIGTDSFVDDGTTSVDCDTHPPTDSQNTTKKVNTLLVTLPKADANMSRATNINLYGSLTGEFGEASSLGQYPVASAGATVAFSALNFNDATPPDVNLSIGGAALIDPDTELLDWHWKRPVTASGLLGSGVVGDVRLVTGTGHLYSILAPSASAAKATEWVRVGSAGVRFWTPVATPGVVELSRTSFEKTSPNQEEGQLYSQESYTGPCYVSWRVSQNNKGLGLGLNTDPKTDAGFTSIDYFLNCSSTGTIIIRENGVEVGAFGSYAAGDVFEIIYDGKWVRYWKNGEILREVERAVGAPLFLDSWWNNPGGQITEVVFAPMAAEPPFLVASAASGNPGRVQGVQTLRLVGSGGASVSLKQVTSSMAEFVITAGGGGGSLAIFGSGSAAAGAETAAATKVELIGSGGINIKETSPGGGVAKAVVEGMGAVLADGGMGVMVLTTAQKGAARPKAFKQVTWYCKEKPTNMAEFDIWIEEGP